MSRDLTNKKMLIGELSRISGFSKDTLRYYEKLGVIKEVDRKNNLYREYGYETLKILEVVHVSKDLGFTLMEIKSHVNQILHKNPTRHEIKAIMENQLLEIDRKIAELKEVKSRIRIMIEVYSD